jgi:ribosomal protein S4
MPIPPALRPLYRTPSWKQAKALVRKRSRNECEECHKPNGAKIRTRTGGGLMIWRLRGNLTWFNQEGLPVKLDQFNEILERVGRIRDIRVVLTTAHLNHIPGDDRLENLKELCQWCHLRLDAKAHRASFVKHRDDARTLLVEASA